ncbi:CPBP family intramembrane metalloprotease [Bacillus sp. RG28]|uniref:CPBP family intramembrane metalloprotease n=1 Tax=Gottfriedia endophytica TaxID=2820819 RepID=A0A940NN52_9BACI|nr:CPBP family intramembrane glutamic endopeptidase [Gottfriedia endophytica]MBP0723761.1 CPBP family intramembrane metalloprotease [Gottfriedia endophytica]
MNSELQTNSLKNILLPNERKSALKTLGYYILFFIIGTNLLVIFSMIWLVIFHRLFDFNLSDLQINSFIDNFGVYADLISDALSLYWLYYYTKKHGILTLRKINLTWKDILLIIGSFIAITLFSYGITTVFDLFNASVQTPNNQTVVEDYLKISPLPMIISAVFLAPLKEEWLTRKLIIGSIFKNHPVIGVIVSSLCFGLLHMIAGFSIFGLLQYSLAGLLFGILYVRTKKIEVSIAAHFLNNFISICIFYFSLK